MPDAAEVPEDSHERFVYTDEDMQNMLDAAKKQEKEPS